MERLVISNKEGKSLQEGTFWSGSVSVRSSFFERESRGTV